MGSWKIMLTFPPRIWRISSLSSPYSSMFRSFPFNETSPPVIFPGREISWRILIMVTDFPLPDSPTIPDDLAGI